MTARTAATATRPMMVIARRDWPKCSPDGMVCVNAGDIAHIVQENRPAHNEDVWITIGFIDKKSFTV